MSTHKMSKNLPFQGQFCHTVLEQAKFAVVACLMSVEVFHCMPVLAVRKGSGDKYKKVHLRHSTTELIMKWVDCRQLTLIPILSLKPFFFLVKDLMLEVKTS